MGGCGSKVLDNTKLGKHHFDFQIIIGEGGFGKVNAVISRIKKTEDGKDQWYAIKTMAKAQILKKSNNHGLDMLFNERNLLADLKSDFLINMHHCFQDDDSCYIVMDLMLGGDLRFHMARRDFFNENDARFYIALCALSLRACHKNWIIHRDVKPDNIVLGPDGYAKLTDFGISVRISEETPYCTLGSGTKPYMAPEMLSHSHKHGLTADIYMLGIMAFELLTGRRPYKEGVKKDTVRWVEECMTNNDLTDELPYAHKPALPEAKFKLSEACNSFISGCLEPRPWARLATGTDAEWDSFKKHAYFEGFDWVNAEAHNATAYPAPVTPNKDTANCDTVGNNLVDTLMGEEKQERLTPEEQENFIDYDYKVELTPPEEAPSS
mmetsp:Transcript_20681/g.47943  ORF Transcript_20681/g.47943 Transcript_20681/m.47943 type:complete len:380 (+) Transcript_20681:112-1251(+)|eukprot:CAMPEP_0182578468 /NCGR_PEP_ID=MMETSP1324-20130603/41115_1 /TAXON_ID=236786 /ORGANISM="Florenciella sp., Strain RCC1587" /LENGTH=379 /DNA_ID=CAMNT_0024794419 /DNA_START=36 /DNA_END=1175 /DNA_ORIENTATION=+